MEKKVCLLNDSFPPYIDGVANAVNNYAKNLNNMGTEAFVVTPRFPNADDSQYNFKVIRMNTFSGEKVNKDGYTIGNPWDHSTIKQVKNSHPDVLHTHCLASGFFMGIDLKKKLHIPLIVTYHTKYDIALNDMVPTKIVQDTIKNILVSHVNKYCDELWAVSNGAGKNIQSLGYEGDYIVMRNGVDLPKKIIDDITIERVTKEYDLPKSIPMFIFVGRLYWYKGIKIILDAMAKLKANGKDFRMVFVGNGKDEEEIRKYNDDLKLNDKCIFVPPVLDREELMAWYSRADLLLLPSTFDTNGLVVREASASSLPSLLIKGSCASEDVTDDVDGFLIDENAESMYDKLLSIMDNKELLKRIGENASNNLYLSWEDAVKIANDRYDVVIENAKKKNYRRFLFKLN